MRAGRVFLLLLLILPVASFGQSPDRPERVVFNRDIRPILSDNCFHCHGPDRENREAGLRLDREDDAFAPREGIKTLVPGKPEQSELYRRIIAKDESERMPPADSGRSLSAREKELIKCWITEGAKWQPHWSLILPTSPKIPYVRKTGWAVNPIDRFILSRLEQEGLAPSPEAGKIRLIRRVTFDLTGLPPTPAEVDAFLADDEPGSYQRLVDRLLASPRYAERMAIDWLDAARYADTSGYQNDGPREMWRWRDWVIDAYRDHMPFDQFTIEQLAGDLLPEPSLSQRIATGFNRNHRGNAEGGIIPEEFACEYVVDRVETTFTVWQGLTIGCARCHEHKFDPVSQKEFYQLYAFFNNIPEFGRAIKEGNSPPFIKAPTHEQRRRLDEIESQLKQAERGFAKVQTELEAAQAEWETKVTKYEVQWFPGEKLLAHFPLDGDLTEAVTPPMAPPKEPEITFEKGPVDQAARYEGNGTEIADLAGFGYFDKFSFTCWIKPEKPTGTILSKMQDTARAAGYAVRLENGKLQVNLVKRWLDDAIRVETARALPLNQWLHLAVTYDGSRVARGIRVYLNGEPVELVVKLDLINQSFDTEEPFRIAQGGGPGSGFEGLLDDLRIYADSLSPETVAILSEQELISEIARLPEDRRTKKQQRKLRTYFLEHNAPSEIQRLWKRRNQLREERAELTENLPTVMVMQENPQPAPAFFLNRGQYDQPGERVERDVPESLPAFPDAAPKNRLGLAHWLVNGKNPLTARVAVNRLWQMSFGTGLVKTAEDFGSQGEPPSHPELLDWLAVELVERDWRLEEIQRLIVTSAAYRQSSKVSLTLRERDPENRLYARGPRFRMPAAMIRDQALFASGLLAERLGGPSVKPYQPAGLWTELANEKPYQHGQGEDLYRRSLYTYWKRTIGPPSLLALDASTRETCQVRPTRTNTPLQALLLLNDVTFVEASRKLAERAILEAGESSESRLTHLFRVVTSRPPSERELEILEESLESHQERFQANPKAALELLTIGESPSNQNLDPVELASYATIANMVLNLDEAVTRE